MKDTEVKKESMIKKYTKIKKGVNVEKEIKIKKASEDKKENESKKEEKIIAQEFKYPIILCNLSTSASNDRFSSVTGDYLCILYKDVTNKAKYLDIDLHSDINLISFSNEDKPYVYFKAVSEKGLLGTKMHKVISKVEIPENIMFK